ncbi:hypothetical protein BCR34DRAFT_660319 [Clohesyomyces aquaticus]|uniref:Uncharacterized protein n=1 Tax=Clohesyomyces aquaticus TaxID=1231657 RepID=A0A1Y2A778_9PLEO|nr:hypothetical protein BCR34DRAFT_660319 [Clohesyomyces aquaticus]
MANPPTLDFLRTKLGDLMKEIGYARNALHASRSALDIFSDIKGRRKDLERTLKAERKKLQWLLEDVLPEGRDLSTVADARKRLSQGGLVYVYNTFVAQVKTPILEHLELPNRDGGQTGDKFQEWKRNTIALTNQGSRVVDLLRAEPMLTWQNNDTRDWYWLRANQPVAPIQAA